MDSKYNFKLHEEKIYQLWEKNNAFSPDNYQNKKNSFCIMMPPPNANDPLHIGHAMFVTLEDILTRYHRMRGEDALWLPGTDHAGIETQFVFEKKLAKKKQSRFDFDRESLYQKIWDYVQENSGIAVSQMKKIGASADWSRFKFMLDQDIVETVLKTFIKLNNQKLIYRDLKLVNYCTKCGTSFSELEVNHIEQTDQLYTIQYGPLQVSTVRPETIFGDIALAVNPADKRYQNYIGQEITANFPWGKIKLPVIADKYVKTDFGTGVLKITPYHDQNDWDVWQRHVGNADLRSLPAPKQIINTRGKLINCPKKYLNLNINQAREQILNDLKNKKLLIKTEKHTHSVGHCYRCQRIIEPLPLAQFFIKIKSLTQPVLEVLKNKKLKIYGAGHDKILTHWLENLKDWNISRQIVWGIQLPVWYSTQDEKNTEIQVLFLDQNKKLINLNLKQALAKYDLKIIKQGLQSLTAPANSKYQISINSPGENFIQETDTFDTWFSSAQWPFAAMNKKDFERFYPTQVLETGYDILPFWVMRMLMMGKFITGQFPFSKVYLHGLIRDQKGQKMSKSKGNVINPLEIVQKYGADSLRMALVIRSSPGLDKNVGEQDFRAMRNLGNKIWNAARFVQNFDNKNKKIINKNFNQKLNNITQEITKHLDNYQIGLAAETVYNEFWHWFCDICIEDAKAGKLSKEDLKLGLKTFLKLLHPFVPFVTEAVWQNLVGNADLRSLQDLLIASSWPSVTK